MSTNNTYHELIPNKKEMGRRGDGRLWGNGRRGGREEVRNRRDEGGGEERRERGK